MGNSFHLYQILALYLLVYTEQVCTFRPYFVKLGKMLPHIFEDSKINWAYMKTFNEISIDKLHESNHLGEFLFNSNSITFILDIIKMNHGSKLLKVFYSQVCALCSTTDK